MQGIEKPSKTSDLRKLNFALPAFPNNENVLMWAHYADNYSGMCIEYSALDLIARHYPARASIRIAYVDEPPEISQNEAKNAGDAAAYISRRRKAARLMKREWRVLADKGEVRFGLEQPTPLFILALEFGFESPTRDYPHSKDRH